MRSLFGLVVVGALACLGACENSPLGSEPSFQLRPTDQGSAGAAAPPANGGGGAAEVIAAEAGAPVEMSVPIAHAKAGVDAAAEASAVDASAEASAVDAGAEASAGDAGAEASAGDAAAEAPAISCAALAAAGTPERLKDFQWQYEVPTQGPYNPPYDSVTIGDACALTYQHTILPPNPKSTTRAVTMSAIDCSAARGWATNARFLEVLRTGDECPYGEGNPGDVFDLTLTDEGRVARKTYLCPEPTLEAVRGCLRALVDRSFAK